MGADEGKMTKSLRWSKATGTGRAGYYIALYVTEKTPMGPQKKECGVSLTPGEFYQFKVLVEYCIPRLLGFDYLLDQPVGV